MFWPRRVIHVCSPLEPCHICVLCALLLFVFPPCSYGHKWGGASVWIEKRWMFQNNPKRTTLAAPGVRPEFHYGWNSFLFPILFLWDECQMPAFTLQCGNTEHMLSLTLIYKSFTIQVNLNEIQSLFHVCLVIKNVKT